MARPISYKGQVRKIARAYRNRDHGEVLWELVGLLIRDLEEDPSKIPGFGNSIHDSGSKGCFSRKNLAFYSMLVAK